MKDFNIDDMLKYLITGIWIYFLLHQANILPEIIRFDKELNVIVLSFSIGIVMYFSSRTFLYPLLQRVLDKCFLPKDTGRNYIKEQFEIDEWGIRNDLHVLFHQKHSKKYAGPYPTWVSSFLTMYSLAISTPIAIVLIPLLGAHGVHHILVYIAFSIVFLVVGGVSNCNYEKRVFRNTVIISDPTLKEFVQDYLDKKSKLSQQR